MTPSQLLQRLSAMREIFPTPIIQEWSLAEYTAGMKELAALDRWHDESGHKMETVSDFSIFDS
jgi:hypothetical protein